jgi:hypothetical protein
VVPRRGRRVDETAGNLSGRADLAPEKSLISAGSLPVRLLLLMLGEDGTVLQDSSKATSAVLCAARTPC